MIITEPIYAFFVATCLIAIGYLAGRYDSKKPPFKKLKLNVRP